MTSDSQIQIHDGDPEEGHTRPASRTSQSTKGTRVEDNGNPRSPDDPPEKTTRPPLSGGEGESAIPEDRKVRSNFRGVYMGPVWIQLTVTL